MRGKVPRNYDNMRTDVAWVCALDATHHPIPKLRSLSDNLYDVGVMILPKIETIIRVVSQFVLDDIVEFVKK